jgi:two-component system sensor histidine kinase HydH
MKLRLGIPESLVGAPLTRRLLWLNLIRLLVLILLLVLIGSTFASRYVDPTAESGRLALITVALSFALTGASTFVLKRGLQVERIADTHLVLDQVTWTVLIYVSGGINSAATPFYGLTCVAGAISTGLRGAWLAAGAAIASYGVMTLGFWRGWLSGPSDQPRVSYLFSSEDLAYHAGLNVLGVLVVTLLAGYLAERLRLTGGKLVVAEARAESAERMAALGRLATGLAHEIRNPLGSISGCVQLLQSAPGLDAEERQMCSIIRREASRLDDLVTDMIDLTRPRQPSLEAIDVIGTVRDVVDLASSSGRAVSDVIVRYVGPPGCLCIRADAAQLRQLIWNLIRNAVQASSPGDDVLVRVSNAGGRACLSVIDQGIGIDPDARDRLFDAFFTTRSHGTGVGLAVVKRIADEHGFAVQVQSQQGQGATFSVDMGPADYNDKSA